MRQFYRDLIGLSYAGTLSFKGFSIEAYRFGNSTLKLTLPPEAMMPSAREPNFGNGLTSIRVTDAEAVAKEAEKQGVNFVVPLQADDVGDGTGKSAILVDPMGNLVEIVEMLEGKLPWD